MAELIVRELRLRPFTDVAPLVDRACAVESTSETRTAAATMPTHAHRLVARHSRLSAHEDRAL